MSAPIIVTANMGGEDQAWADGLRRLHFPPERNYLSAHITLFHHLPPAILPELKQALAELAQDEPPDAWLGGLINLGRGVAYRIESPKLLDIRTRLAERFAGLLTPQDQARPRLHITIQNKVSPGEARELFEQLSQDFEPRPLSISALACYYYRGGPWEFIRSYTFRG